VDRREATAGPTIRALTALREWYTVKPGKKHLGVPQHLLLIVVVCVLGVYMVTWGNERFGAALVQITGGNGAAQLALGAGWMIAAIGVALHVSYARRDTTRRAWLYATSLTMWFVAFLVVPPYADGAGEYAIRVQQGAVAGLLVGGLGWWLAHRRRLSRRAQAAVAARPDPAAARADRDQRRVTAARDAGQAERRRRRKRRAKRR